MEIKSKYLETLKQRRDHILKTLESEQNKVRRLTQYKDLGEIIQYKTYVEQERENIERLVVCLNFHIDLSNELINTARTIDQEVVHTIRSHESQLKYLVETRGFGPKQIEEYERPIKVPLSFAQKVAYKLDGMIASIPKIYSTVKSAITGKKKQVTVKDLKQIHFAEQHSARMAQEWRNAGWSEEDSDILGTLSDEDSACYIIEKLREKYDLPKPGD